MQTSGASLTDCATTWCATLANGDDLTGRQIADGIRCRCGKAFEALSSRAAGHPSSQRSDDVASGDEDGIAHVPER